MRSASDTVDDARCVGYCLEDVARGPDGRLVAMIPHSTHLFVQYPRKPNVHISGFIRGINECIVFIVGGDRQSRQTVAIQSFYVGTIVASDALDYDTIMSVAIQCNGHLPTMSRSIQGPYIGSYP